jgi:hypothetical protein
MHRFSFWPVREHSPHAVWTGYPRQGDLFVEGDAEPAPEVLLEEAACAR